MSYQVFARKLRPAGFDALVGQDHVVRALVHALENGRVHHAYLFTGTRGVGKTTIARILAKCLNCETGVTPTPCGVCSACREISEGRFVDLIEVDAASRTKVDDTRDLLDNAQYLPARGRYKVYLIDEVHMLSTHSFNALAEDARRTAAAREIHARDDRSEEAADHGAVTVSAVSAEKSAAGAHFDVSGRSPDERIDRVRTARVIGDCARRARQHARRVESTDQAVSYGGGHVRERDVLDMLGSIGRDDVEPLLRAVARRRRRNGARALRDARGTSASISARC